MQREVTRLLRRNLQFLQAVASGDPAKAKAMSARPQDPVHPESFSCSCLQLC